MDEESQMAPYTERDFMLSLMATVGEIKSTVTHMNERNKEFQATVEAKLEKMEQQSTVSDTKLQEEFTRLIEERTKYAATRQDGIKAELNGRIDSISTAVLNHGTAINALNIKLEELSNKGKNKVYGYFEKIIDKLVWLLIAGVGALIWKWVTTPPMPV